MSFFSEDTFKKYSLFGSDENQFKFNEFNLNENKFEYLQFQNFCGGKFSKNKNHFLFFQLFEKLNFYLKNKLKKQPT
jgi:hypothetical protein